MGGMEFLKYRASSTQYQHTFGHRLDPLLKTNIFFVVADHLFFVR
jgi:hypothetical protein